MSALEGEGSEDPNMAVGRPASSYARATPSRSPRRNPRPCPSGRAVRAGVLRQMVQHVLLALLLGDGAPGAYKMMTHFFISDRLWWQFMFHISWRCTARWCSGTTRGKTTWTSRRPSTLAKERRTSAWRGSTRIPCTLTWRRNTFAMGSSLSGWWSTAFWTTGQSSHNVWAS